MCMCACFAVFCCCCFVCFCFVGGGGGGGCMCGQMVPADTYQVSHPTRQDSLDNHTSAAPPNDAKPQTGAIID